MFLIVIVVDLGVGGLLLGIRLFHILAIVWLIVCFNNDSLLLNLGLVILQLRIALGLAIGKFDGNLLLVVLKIFGLRLKLLVLIGRIGGCVILHIVLLLELRTLLSILLNQTNRPSDAIQFECLLFCLQN